MKDRVIYRERGRDALYKTWHASQKHMLLYFHAGSGSVVCAEKVFPIEAGALVFLAAGTYHYTVPDVPQVYERSKLFLTPEEWERLLDLLNPENRLRDFSGKAVVYARLPADEAERIGQIYREMTLCHSRDEGELLLHCCAMRLLCYLHQYSRESTAAAPGIMGKAVEYINRHIAENLSIDRVCAAVGISKYHFCRRFKEYTGLTVMQYVLKTRITLAKNELSRSTLSVARISEQYGFSSISYFCRVFREEEGCTPLQFRNGRH